MSWDGRDFEPCAIWDSEMRKARKAHMCNACKRTITPGERYEHTDTMHEGSFGYHKRCAPCVAIYEHLRAKLWDERRAFCRTPLGQWDGDFDPITEEISHLLDCEHRDYAKRWGVEPPAWVQALAFWVPGDPLPEGAKP